MWVTSIPACCVGGWVDEMLYMGGWVGGWVGGWDVYLFGPLDLVKPGSFPRPGGKEGPPVMCMYVYRE